ncbi:fructokinase [Massilia sp. JS1662]|nr:PfkB family carbohydrate kinase [Massilia sp. JS1662]KGF81046.1 fructokinase [Massilia sp. JS1662]
MTQRVMGTVAVFGEALVDDFGDRQVIGGAPFNVARHLAALGQDALMLTRVGLDENGARMRAEFERFGLPMAGLQVDAALPTGRVSVERHSDGGHRFTILPHQAYDAIEAEPAVAAMTAAAPATLYFGTLAQREPASRDALGRLLAATDACRYLDLNVRTGQVTERCVFASLHAADIVKVNEEELQDLFGWYTHMRLPTDDMAGADVRHACATLLRVFNLTGLIVTLGPRGAVYFGADGAYHATPAPGVPVQLADTVGAGDAFSAVFLLGRARGWPLDVMLARANAFAGAVCGIVGAVPDDRAFYRPFIERWEL